MHSTAVRRIIRVVTATTVAATASAALLLAPVSDEAANTLRAKSVKANTLANTL